MIRFRISVNFRPLSALYSSLGHHPLMAELPVRDAQDLPEDHN
jgi:hypothetical protein